MWKICVIYLPVLCTKWWGEDVNPECGQQQADRGEARWYVRRRGASIARLHQIAVAATPAKQGTATSIILVTLIIPLYYKLDVYLD